MAKEEVLIGVKVDTKQAQKSLGQLEKSIDNVSESTKEDVKELNTSVSSMTKSFSDGIGEIGDSFGALGSPLASARQGVASLSQGFKAMLANPVVLVIAGIVAGLAALYKAFTRSEDGANKMAIAFAYLEGLLIPLIKGAETLATTLYDAFSNPQEALDSFVKGVEGFFDGFIKSIGFLGTAIKKLFEGDFDAAIEASKKAFEPVVKVFKEAAKAVDEYAVAADKMGKANSSLVEGEKQLAAEQRQNTVSLAQQLKEREKLMNVRDNELLSIDERIAANEELNKIELKQATESERIAQKAVDLAAERIRLHGKTTENLDALANAETELANIQADSLGRQNEFILNRQGLQREAAEYSKADIDFEFEKLSIIEKNEAKILLAKVKTLEKTSKLYGKDTIEYKETLKQKQLAELEYQQFVIDTAEQTAIKKCENEGGKWVAGACDFSEKIEKEKAANIESAKASAVDLTNQVASAVFEANAANLQRETNQKLNVVQETQNRETELIDAKLENGIINEQQAAQAKERIEKEAAKKQEQIEKEAFKKNQDIQIKQALANGALAVTNILATVPKFDFGVSTAILTAASIASTALQVATIKSQKFAKGGILQGSSHANGGIDMGNNQEAEGGEAIINKRSTAMFREELSMINQAGGGVKFARGGVLSGGSSNVEGGSTMTAQLQELIEISKQPTRAVVSETEITDSQNRINNIESRSSF